MNTPFTHSRISKAIETTIHYLAVHQRKKGDFQSFASNSAFAKSGDHEPRDTTFSTSLILIALRNVSNDKAAKKILDRGVHFLLGERSESWTWNYWQRRFGKEYNKRVPDDFDDTSCAVAAISLSSPEKIDGEVIGTIVRNLIAAEENPGGPYHTWIVSENIKDAWKDVDPVVNANIGYMLACNSISLPSLTSYIEVCIEREDYPSLYYFSPVISLYFISRFYKGTASRKARQQILKKRNMPSRLCRRHNRQKRPECIQKSYLALKKGLKIRVR